jgi:hypothetical protein
MRRRIVRAVVSSEVTSPCIRWSNKTQRNYDFGKMGLVLRNTFYFDAWKDGHFIGHFDTLNRAVNAYS